MNVYRFSRRWQSREFHAVSRNYTHVLLESAKPLFGQLFRDGARGEVCALRERGLRVGLVSHGSDLRDPTHHAEMEEWSPYRDSDWSRLSEYRRASRRHRQLLQDTGTPLLVSTPDLLGEWPGATWLPVVIDWLKWTSRQPVLVARRPRVIHVPSSPFVKGSHLINDVMKNLHDQRVVDYQTHEGVQHYAMPSIVGESDIVLDQFRLGAYGVASVEAMAAGRLVVAHIRDDVRRTIKDRTGLALPIVSATPETLRDVLCDIVERPDHYRTVAERGPKFAELVHGGHLTSDTLARFLNGAPN